MKSNCITLGSIAILMVMGCATQLLAFCPIIPNSQGVIEGVGMGAPIGVTRDTAEPDPGGGFSSGEGQVIKTELPGGGFSSGEGEITRTELPGGGFSSGEGQVTKTELPGGGFSGSEGQIIKITPKKEPVSSRKPRQPESTWTSDDFDPAIDDPDFNDPFFNDPYGAPVGPRYLPPMPSGFGRGFTMPDTGGIGRAIHGLANPPRRQPVRRIGTPSRRGGVGFMGGARRVSPARARQLQRSFR